MSEIERELEEALHRVLDPIAARPIPPRSSRASRSAFRTVIGGAGTALTVKVLTGVVAAAAAVTVAGAVTTGSLSPADWGQQVSQKVETCKHAIANSGRHAIGDCVSDFANQPGVLVSSDARHQGDTNPNGNSSGGSKDKDKSKHTPSPGPRSQGR